MENQRVERQPTHPALALIHGNPAMLSQQGAVVAGWRRRGQRGMGPYYRLCQALGRRRSPRAKARRVGHCDGACRKSPEPCSLPVRMAAKSQRPYPAVSQMAAREENEHNGLWTKSLREKELTLCFSLWRANCFQAPHRARYAPSGSRLTRRSCFAAGLEAGS